MKDFSEIREQVKEKLTEVNDSIKLSDFWQEYLGKTGVIQGLMKQMKTVPADEKPAFGKAVNDVREWAQELYKQKQAESVLLEKAGFVPLYYKNEYFYTDGDSEGIIYSPFTKTVDFSGAVKK